MTPPLLTWRALATLILIAQSALAQRPVTGGRDSAGIRIVTYAAPTGPPITMSATPVMTFVESDPCLFVRPTIAAIVPEGYIVSDAAPAPLCLFGKDGRFLRTIGRRGRGPAEYVSLSHVESVRGDTIAVFDGSQRRLTLFTAGGTLVRTTSIATPADSVQPFPSAMLGLRDGTVLLAYPFPEPKTRGRQFFRQEFFRFDRAGAPLSRLGAFPIGEHLIVTQFLEHKNQLPNTAYYDAAFGAFSAYAATEMGFATTDGSDYSVREYRASGVLSTIHRVALPITPVDAAAIARYRATEMAGATTARDRAETEYVLGLMTYPKTTPAVTDILTDPRGRIWLQRYAERPVSGPRQWIVLDPTTRQASTFTARAGFEMTAVTASSVCGSTRDRDDVSTLRCYSIQ